MTRRHIASGSSFEADIAYSRAVVDGDWIFVSGTTGFDYTTMSLASGVRYIVPVAAEFELCWPVLRRWFGEVRPAATMISAGLADARMRIEIEVTARKES